MKIETMNDFYELIKIVDYLKYPTLNILFVHKATKEKIDGFTSESYKKGGLSYLGEFNYPGIKCLCITIAGYTFHITTCPDEMPEYIAQSLGQIKERADKFGYKP